MKVGSKHVPKRHIAYATLLTGDKYNEDVRYVRLSEFWEDLRRSYVHTNELFIAQRRFVVS